MTCATCKYQPIWQGPDSKGRKWGNCQYPIKDMSVPASCKVISVPVECFPDGFGLPEHCRCYEDESNDV